MDKIIKLVANQGGPFTQNQNLVDFDIPADGNYDLSDSYVNLYSTITSTEAVADQPPGAVYNCDLQIDNAENLYETFYNVCFIKNASMSTQLKGRLEDINRVDILRQNLNDLTLSRQDIKGLSYRHVKNLNGTDTEDTFYDKQSIFRELHKEGSNKSRELVTPIRIPLSQIFNLGSLKNYPASKLGRTRIHLELNVDNFKPDILRMLDPSGTLAFGCDNIGGAGTANGTTFNTIVVTPQLLDLKSSPFYVGQKINVRAAPNNAPDLGAAGKNVVILGISRQTATNKLVLTVTTLGTATADAGGYTDVTVNGFSDASKPTLAFKIQYAQLTLRKLSRPPKSPTQINYTTFSTEQGQGNNLTNYQKQYQVEPNAVNCFIMFPRGNNSFVSNNFAVKSCRLRLNNEDLWNREMFIQNGYDNQSGDIQLYRDRLMMTLLNGGYRLKNLLLRNLSSEHSDSLLQAEDVNNMNENPNITIIATPLPLTANEKNLQVNITAPRTVGIKINNNNATPQPVGVNEIILYKQLVQQLKL